MLGWQIRVYRLTEPNRLAASSDVPALLVAFPREADREALLESLDRKTWIAAWQTGLGGLTWIHDLVKSQQALDLPGNAYPYPFVGLARDLLPRILAGPPDANRSWASGEHDILSPNWAGGTVINQEEASSTRPGEWLLVEAWDES